LTDYINHNLSSVIKRKAHEQSITGFLMIGAVVAIVIAWFSILITGRYPKPLFNYVVGVGRWSLRVNAYAFLLVTDRYPPFSLKAE
jgi:hypothetical protein